MVGDKKRTEYHVFYFTVKTRGSVKKLRCLLSFKLLCICREV
jgi:hypothetical protein